MNNHAKGKPPHSSSNQIAGIILAAGDSTRMGQPKLLLTWRGEPIIRHVACTAIQSKLASIIVVIGDHADQIKDALQDLPLLFAENTNWMNGQSTSMRSGLIAIPEEITAAIFLLGDQPKITAALVDALIDAHSKYPKAVIAPMISGRRGNPVLFDRSVFKDLLNLSGDAGARQIFDRYPPHYIPWDDPAALLDIDTPEDYQQLLRET